MNIPTQEIIDIVRKTRTLTLPQYGNVEVKEYKSDLAADAVTEIDQKVEEQLKQDLAGLFPEIPFVGEEFGGDREVETFWLSDPIDGTAHYVRGIPFCTTMLALIHKGEVIFSIIYDFVHDDVYHAERGKGAYKNDERISISDRPLAQAYMSCECQELKEENQAFMKSIKEKALLVKMLSSGYEFMLVATGKIEARIVYDGFGSDYDYAPGTLLVKEAGGVVKNLGSDSYDYRNLNFIAASPQVYGELIEEEGYVSEMMK